MEENQQDFQPSIVGKVIDLVVQRSVSMGNGPYAQKTVYHVNIVTNTAELP